MRWCAVLFLAAVALAGTAPETPAQIFGSKKTKTPPQQRVPELIGILKTDKDAHKRSDAAEELRQFEPKDFPDIVPALIDALQSDAASGVRIEAAAGLGRLRPITVPAGQALEKAAANDANLRVRIQAKASLVYYQMSGYHAPKKTEPQPAVAKTVTDEPPLAANKEPWWQNGQGAKMPSGNNVYKPLPSGPLPGMQPPLASVPTPGTTSEPPLAPSQGPPLQSTPPALEPAPTWVPATPPQAEGPRLVPPQ